MSKQNRVLAVADRQNHDKKSRVQNWLMQEGWQIGEAHNPGAAWVIGATTPAGHPLGVIQPHQPADVLVINSSVSFDDKFSKQLEALDQGEVEEKLWSLRLSLLQMGVEFDGVNESPKQITVSQRIYDDGLTKDAFLQRVNLVKRALIFTVWSLMKDFNKPHEEWPDSLN